MPAAMKFSITVAMRGTPATGTSGFGIAKPARRSRLPSPAAMMPPVQVSRPLLHGSNPSNSPSE